MYLASQSPRRRALLDSLGISYEVAAPAYEEESEGLELPGELVERHSRGKAWSVVGGLKPLPPGRPILGVDTIVVMHGRSVGKAADAEEALTYLKLLSGAVHLVYSGVTLIWSEPGSDRLLEATDHAVTEVRFSALSERELELYVASGEWRGKAGAYAIQERGSAFVTEIHGEYTNVVGLPVSLLVEMLKNIGLWPPAEWASYPGE